jgi:hypothetical protein
MTRAVPAALATMQAAVPLLPSLISLLGFPIPGVSLVPLPVAYGLVVLIALLEVYWFLVLARTPDRPSPLRAALLAWWAAVVLAALAGFHPERGALFLVFFGLAIVWHEVLHRFYTHAGTLRAVLGAFCLSGLAASVIAIVTVVLRKPAALYVIAHGRAVGTFVVPGELAGYALVLVPIAAATGMLARARWLRLSGWAAAATGTAALILSFSRTGWVAAACACAFFLACTLRGAAKRWTVVAVAAALIAVAVLFNAHHNPSENYTRLSIWQAAFGMIDRFPLTGVGPFDFAVLYPALRLPDGDPVAYHAHSVYLTLFAETGIVGLAAFAYTWYRFARTFGEAIRNAQPRDATFAFAVAAALVGTLVQGIIDTVTLVPFGLWLPTMALALGAARHGLYDGDGTCA